MRKLLFLLCFLFTKPLLALDYSTETALSSLKSCLEKADLSCALTGTCTVCDWCGKIEKEDSNKCKKSEALSALEGILGIPEGQCSVSCGSKKHIGKPVLSHAKEGDKATVLIKNKAGGLAAVVDSQGRVTYHDFTSQAPGAPGDEFTVAASATAGPVNSAVQCVRGTTNKWVKECFKGWVNCDSNIKKSERCSICKDIKTCGSDTQEFMSAFFGLNRSFCTGC